MVIKTAGGKHEQPFADEFRILVLLFSRYGRMEISQEERMQSANKAWWRDAKRYRCKSVPWWTSTCASVDLEDMLIRTMAGGHRLPLSGKFNILGYIFNREENFVVFESNFVVC